MAVRVYDPIDFQRAERIFTGGRSRALHHNTYLERVNEDTFAVVLYRTQILLIHRDGTFTLNAGGWQTVTTKERINRFSPAQVYSKARRWFVGGVEFTDGLKVRKDGSVIGADASPESLAS